MSQRYDVMTARTYTDGQGNERTAWTRIGTMFPMDGDRFSISFDALPTPQVKNGKAETRAVCFPPKERDDKQPPRDMDDRDVPF